MAPLGPCVFASLVYIGSLRFSFLYDDHSQILLNPHIRAWAQLPRILTSDLWSQRGAEHLGYYYRPVFSIWLLLMHTIAGFSPVIWHLSNVFLHMVATYFVFKLGFALLGDAFAASSAATVFAIHPIHIEPVCWVSASDEILYSLFYLCAILALAKGFAEPSRRLLWSLLSLLGWAAALFSKETAVSLLPLFFYLYYEFTESASTTRAKRLSTALKIAVPCISIALLFLLTRWLVLEHSGLEEGRHTWKEVLATSPGVGIFYLSKLLWPTHLSGFYVNPLLTSATPLMVTQWAVILVMLALLGWIAVKRSLVIGTAAGLLFLPLLPVLIGLRIFREGDLTHDRYLYLPSVGLGLFAGLAVKHLLAQVRWIKISFAALGSAILLILVWLNLTQQSFYKDDESFYHRAIEVGPSNALVMDFLGDYYMSQKQTDRAIEQFKLAKKAAPGNPDVSFTLAKALFETYKYSEAAPILAELSKSSKLSEGRRELSLLCLGQSEIRLGDLKQAEVSLLRLQGENYSYPLLHDTLGALYQSEGRLPEALREYFLEFSISGNIASRQKALRLTEFLKSRPATTESAPPSH
jgi:tetratricopeptide (TPR) repeat protein